jgi:O-acetyl-ADP-ribose deacetylase (regulator of RNase III)
MSMNKVRGDFIALAASGKYDVAVQGCNCFCQMGAGLAKQIKKHFPEAYVADCKTPKGDRRKLGTYTAARLNEKTILVNAYTQFGYGRMGGTEYGALHACFRAIARDFPEATVLFPRIGAGLGGGDWAVIARLIDAELGGRGTLVTQP